MTTFYIALFSALRLDFVILALSFVFGLVTAAAGTTDGERVTIFPFKWRRGNILRLKQINLYNLTDCCMIMMDFLDMRGQESSSVIWTWDEWRRWMRFCGFYTVLSPLAPLHHQAWKHENQWRVQWKASVMSKRPLSLAEILESHQIWSDVSHFLSRHMGRT